MRAHLLLAASMMLLSPFSLGLSVSSAAAGAAAVSDEGSTVATVATVAAAATAATAASSDVVTSYSVATTNTAQAVALGALVEPIELEFGLSADAAAFQNAISSDVTVVLAANTAAFAEANSVDVVVEEEEEEEEEAITTADAPEADAAAAAAAADAAAAEVATADAASNAFVLICAILVITMSVPGIALFYGGLVRAKNVLSILEQCMIVFCMCMVLWLVIGYSWAFSGAGVDTGMYHLFVGNLDRLLLAGINPDSISGSLNELNFVVFQGAFCAISACLIVGATAERVRFGALILGIGIWAVFSYVPLAHMVWGQGFIEHYFAAYDFAGGTVVHINAAVAGIIAAKILGPRTDLHRIAMPPHSLPFTYLGCGLLWIGWFGFNAGSELAPDGVSALAFANTVFAPAAAALTWALLERVLNGKTSSLGSASGVLAGLVAITPACAFVGPVGAIVIGVVASAVCLWGVRGFKRLTKIDDSLDVFGIHGLGAIVGALLTGIFCDPSLGGTGFKGDHDGMVSQFLGQLYSVIFALVWSGVVSVVAFVVAGKVCKSFRVSSDDERAGLDLTFHGERGYNN